MKPSVVFLVAVAAGLVASCGTIDFNSLIAIIDDNGTLANVSPCTLSTTAPATIQAAAVQRRAVSIMGVLPDKLKQDVVVQAALSHAQTVTLKASIALAPRSAAAAVVAPATPAPVAPLTQGDFFKFANLVAEYVLRQPNAKSGVADPFAQMIGPYYQAYYAGKFYTYFGVSFAQPTISMTISDNEITQAAMVFVELLFDNVLSSQVWVATDKTGKKTYYPGGNANMPTLAALNSGNKNVVVPIPTTSGQCMTETKAKLINNVAQQFATAASADSALTIKSVGGLEIGLGVLGKLSLGDNSTLSSLVKNVASEVVLRLTAQLVYKALEHYNIDDTTPAPTPAAILARVASGAPTPAPTKSQNIQALFISPNPR
jgi:hypothetical protein